MGLGTDTGGGAATAWQVWALEQAGRAGVAPLHQGTPHDPPNTHVRARSWLREEASTSTRTNALFSWQLLAPHGWQRLLLVTNPFHQRRSYWTFVRAAADLGEQGGSAFVAPAPCAGHAGYGPALLDAAADQWDWWREVAAVAYYWVRGWL